MAQSPGYPLLDTPEDGVVEELAYVPTDWAATAADAVAWFRERCPWAVEALEDDGRELVATGATSWLREGPCPECDGSGCGPAPRHDDDVSWFSAVAHGP